MWMMLRRPAKEQRDKEKNTFLTLNFNFVIGQSDASKYFSNQRKLSNALIAYINIMHFNQSHLFHRQENTSVNTFYCVKKGLTDNRNITTSIAVDADYYIPT